MRTHFKIIILVNRVTKWIEKTLASVAEQEYSDYEVCVVDSCPEGRCCINRINGLAPPFEGISSANSRAYSPEYVSAVRRRSATQSAAQSDFSIDATTPPEATEQSQFLKTECEKNGWKYTVSESNDELETFLLGVEQFTCADEDVIFSIEGGDWLFSAWALEALNNVHGELGKPVSYSRSVRYRHGEIGDVTRCRRTVKRRRSFRRAPWVYGPMRSFKYGVWKSIPREEIFKSKDQGWEKATFFPLMERAGMDLKYNAQYLYVKNDLVNPTR